MNARKVAAMVKHLEKVAKHSPAPFSREILKVSHNLRVALNEYQKYFQEKLKGHSKTTVKEMSRDEKKKFFTDVDKGWKAKHE